MPGEVLISRSSADGLGVLLGSADLAATPDGARRSRRTLTHLLSGQDGVDQERADQCLFLLSEVVANAITHADTTTCPLLRVMWIRTGDILRTEMYDPDPVMPTVGTANFEDEHGRGMWLLGAMANRWAAEPVPPDRDTSRVGGKVVWFAVRGVWNRECPPGPAIKRRSAAEER